MPLLVGSTPPSAAQMGQAEETGGGHTPRVLTSQPRGRPPQNMPCEGQHWEFATIFPREGWHGLIWVLHGE